MHPNIPVALNTSDNNIDEEMYTPCLEWCMAYDRGVGYFTSGWIAKNCIGMAAFAKNGGKARWITSTILDTQDYEIIKNAATNKEIAEHFDHIIDESVDKIANEIQADVRNAFGWMIYDGIIEMRFAIPTQKLADGDFHDKFGIFYGKEDEKISFSSSMNDSRKGFSNYESFKIFKSWDGMDAYIKQDIDRFERLWKNEDPNIDIFSISDSVKQKLFKLRTNKRPYPFHAHWKKEITNIWKHQDQAVAAFLYNQNGILEMATGTGKTRTALKIIDTLFRKQKIKRVIITMYGNDLLSQWYKELGTGLQSKPLIFRYFATEYRELASFILSDGNAVFLVSRDAKRLPEAIDRLLIQDSSAHDTTLLVFDEVHGLGAPALVRSLSGKISPFRYRLGLSATPERDYDEIGNNFIKAEVGSIIFKFTLENAIEKGILCEFDYIAFDYQLTKKEKRKKRSIISRYAAKKKHGEVFDENDMYRELAMVNKTSEAKLPFFTSFIKEHPEILNRCLIFVETKEYGVLVQNLIIDRLPDFHTYYGEDDEENLSRFAKGEIACLITCKKISEGVDIKSVKHIVLFSSDRGKLVTTQRIGRCLRINPDDPTKKAKVLDFVCTGSDEDNSESQSDNERKEWLTNLSRVRRNENEDL
jgi:superfamily II DNA or RNA helicase